MSHLTIEKRVNQAIDEALAQQSYVSPIDVFLRIGWLQPVHLQDWRKGKISCLERIIQANLNKISYAMKCLRKMAMQKNLKQNETAYLARIAGPKRELRFSVSGNPQIEKNYRTHYISPLLQERKQQRLQKSSLALMK